MIPENVLALGRSKAIASQLPHCLLFDSLLCPSPQSGLPYILTFAVVPLYASSPRPLFNCPFSTLAWECLHITSCVFTFSLALRVEGFTAFTDLLYIIFPGETILPHQIVL